MKLCIVFVVWCVLCSERWGGGGGLLILACGRHDQCGSLKAAMKHFENQTTRRKPSKHSRGLTTTHTYMSLLLLVLLLVLLRKLKACALYFLTSGI